MLKCAEHDLSDFTQFIYSSLDFWINPLSKLEEVNGKPQLSESWVNPLEQSILADVLIQKIDNIKLNDFFLITLDKFKPLITSIYREMAEL